MNECPVCGGEVIHKFSINRCKNCGIRIVVGQKGLIPVGEDGVPMNLTLKKIKEWVNPKNKKT